MERDSSMGKRAFHHDLLVNSVLKQNIVDAETRSLMSKFGELFIVRAEPSGGEDREFGGAMTPELSGAFDILNLMWTVPLTSHQAMWFCVPPLDRLSLLLRKMLQALVPQTRQKSAL
jgi:hypothetical protein